MITTNMNGKMITTYINGKKITTDYSFFIEAYVPVG